MSSKEIRSIINKNYVELLNESNEINAPISKLATDILTAEYRKLSKASQGNLEIKQMQLFDQVPQLGRHGTFSPNHIESIHRWYPYIEGFSSTFVRNLIEKWGSNARSIHDPFGGTGTTVTVAALMGLKGSYSEINPFMRHVIEAKTNVLRRVALKKSGLEDYFACVLDYALKNKVKVNEANIEIQNAFSGRPYFEINRLVDLLSIRNALNEIDASSSDFKHLGILALGSISVQSSELKRASDLRYRNPKELLPDSFSVFDCFREKLTAIIADIDPALSTMEEVHCLDVDALSSISSDKKTDLIITSPPYLNGTNYFRNTKIELWVSGYIKSEKDLGYYTRRAVTAGINNVSKNGRNIIEYDFVEEIAKQLDGVSYDRRIPELVRRYCSDAEIWLGNCYKHLNEGGCAVVDIGDSKFAGVHVPTEQFLEKIAHKVGLVTQEVELVRSRTSKDGTALRQVILVLKKPSLSSYNKTSRISPTSSTSIGDLREKAINFSEQLPHQSEPYNSRNWGHGLHSLCSYQGKLKPAIAHFLVTEFTKPGDVILDPMSGAGTIPLEAFLNGRVALANDLQELGFVLSSAKVNKPERGTVLAELERLLDYVDNQYASQDIATHSNFGFNGVLSEYFEQRTFMEVLAARNYMQEFQCNSPERALIYSSLLHILHGNRPYALSRRSHPVTPLKPAGEYEYRDLRSRLSSKVARSLVAYDVEHPLRGNTTFGCFEDLDYKNSVDAVITSPPFAASTRFYSSNWMRLWMSGWNASDFGVKKERFVEHRQKTSFDVYKIFFEKCSQWLKPNGIVIMHLGKTKKHDMAKELLALSSDFFETAFNFDEDVVGGENFGLKDQGATKAHQYIFLMKK